MRVILVVLLFGCGVESRQVPATQTTQGPLCDAEPRDNGDGTVTSVGCPFEQQYENILHHGTRLSTPEQLLAHGAAQGVTATATCGEWVMGTDSTGVVVFVSTSRGEVRSHGNLHAGFGATVLPERLALPVELR